MKDEMRYLGDLPKIGIRPVIDGRRRGVRESLEDQTMNMAKAVAKLYSENLKHANGHPVECVIADTTIGGVAEAAACAAKFKKENVGVSLSVTPCWCYGSETMDMDPHTPKAIWGFNGTERPGAVYLAAGFGGAQPKGDSGIWNLWTRRTGCRRRRYSLRCQGKIASLCPRGLGYGDHEG